MQRPSFQGVWGNITNVLSAIGLPAAFRRPATNSGLVLVTALMPSENHEGCHDIQDIKRAEISADGSSVDPKIHFRIDTPAKIARRIQLNASATAAGEEQNRKCR